MSSLDSQLEDDWDRSLAVDGGSEPAPAQLSCNSIVFPADGTPGRATHYNSTQTGSVQEVIKKRTLSDLLTLHSEKGSSPDFSIEEAKRIADLLGQWINASSSPYEGEDDFFVRHAQDDITLNASGPFRRVSGVPAEFAGRPRGKSETVNGSRPSSATADGLVRLKEHTR